MATDKYIPYDQDGVEYNLYDMPKGFVIKGDVTLYYSDLTELPDLSEVVIEGNFNCSINQLTSLKGAPKEVGGDFICYKNQLTTLEGAPKIVGGSFVCWGNQLTTLEGAPKEVGKCFECDGNQLTSLKGAPKEVGGFFSCNDNQLTTLKGAPQNVGGFFYCTENTNLTSLYDVQTADDDNKIFCDEELGEKYGSSNSSSEGIKFSDLRESAQYKSEFAKDNIRRKQMEHLEKKQEADAKTKAAFDAWLKQKGIELPKSR